MENHTINSFQDFTDKVAHMPFKVLHRGEPRSYDTYLLPKIARSKVKNEPCIELRNVERDCLELFRLHGMPYLKGNEDKWGLIALAQHHGLPTRLLDWTYNPAVALYFAVREEPNDDGFLYMLHFSDTVNTSLSPDPLEVEKLLLYYPPRIDPRMVVQDSVFTVHPYPFQSAANQLHSKVKIPAKMKTEFKSRLDTLGFTEASLFPGLDSLANWISEIKNF